MARIMWTNATRLSLLDHIFLIAPCGAPDGAMLPLFQKLPQNIQPWVQPEIQRSQTREDEEVITEEADVVRVRAWFELKRCATCDNFNFYNLRNSVNL